MASMGTVQEKTAATSWVLQIAEQTLMDGSLISLLKPRGSTARGHTTPVSLQSKRKAMEMTLIIFVRRRNPVAEFTEQLTCKATEIQMT